MIFRFDPPVFGRGRKILTDNLSHKDRKPAYFGHCSIGAVSAFNRTVWTPTGRKEAPCNAIASGESLVRQHGEALSEHCSSKAKPRFAGPVAEDVQGGKRWPRKNKVR